MEDYISGLSAEEKTQYLNKLKTSNGEILPDPFQLKDWENDVKCLPNITWRDVTEYLIDTPSVFTKEAMKAYKSLEAYDYFVCGHVQDCFYHKISNDHKFCFIKSEVLPSQRQSDNAIFYQAWVCLNKEHGWVHTAHCTCKAGTGSVCSHAAALLFKLETAVHLELNKPSAPTSQLCAWNKSKKSVNPAPLQLIKFNRAKKHQLPDDTTTSTTITKSYSFNNPNSGEHGLSSESIGDLFKAHPKAAFFTSIDITDFQETEEVILDGSETDTDSETEENCIPDTLTSLYSPDSINLSESKLHALCESRYAEYVETYKQRDYDRLTEITINQSLSNAWMYHRAGRITASVAYSVFYMRQKPAESTINTIMQYSDSVDVKYTKYGKTNENKAREYYTNKLSVLHSHFSVKITGFHVNANEPYLGASPDALVSCDCHPTKVLEIKCPFNCQKGIIKGKDFILDDSGEIRKKHPHYFQVQMQMHVTGHEVADLLIYSPASNGNTSIIITIPKDERIISNFLQKAFTFFKSTLLPEIVTRKRDKANENERKFYCVCRRPSFGNMIGCDNSKCKIGWFHYSCVSISRAPQGKWYCKACKDCQKENPIKITKIKSKKK